MAEHGDARARYMLRPDLNEPVLEPYIIARNQFIEKELANARERLQTADEAARKDIEEEIEGYENWLTEMAPFFWMISPEDIAEYRALAPLFALNIDSVMFDNDSGALTALYEDMQRYAQGQIRMDELLRELDKRARMIYLEGQ
jgi:hypothetical protein